MPSLLVSRTFEKVPAACCESLASLACIERYRFFFGVNLCILDTEDCLRGYAKHYTVYLLSVPKLPCRLKPMNVEC
jgi:hypothetical protein